MTPELIEYVKQQLAAGILPEVLRVRLLTQKWDEKTIDQALAEAAKPAAPGTPVASPAPSVPATPPATLPAQPVPSAQPSPPSQPPRRRGSRLWVAAVVLALLLLSGGSAWGYYAYFPGPEQMAANMFARLGEVRSLSYRLSATIEKFFLFGPAIFLLEGFSDLTDPSAPKTQTIISIESGRISPRLEVVAVGKTWYVRIERIPEVFLEFRELEGRWMKVDLLALAEQFGAEAEDVAGKELSPEQIEMTRALVGRARFVKLVENLGMADVEGTATRHFRFEIDKEEFAAFSVEMARIGDPDLSEADLGKMRAVFESQKLPAGEIWIGRWDFLPREAKFDVEVGASGEKIAVVLALADFDKPFEWTEPQDAVPFEQVMPDLFGGIGPGTFPGATGTVPEAQP